MKRGVLTVGAAASLVALIVAALALRPSNDAPLERSRQVLQDDAMFGSAPRAAATVADVSEALLDDGQSCREAKGSDPRCSARLSVAAFASVTAFVVAECTAPGVYRARRALLSYIDAVVVFDRQPLGTMPAPEPPPVPTCVEPDR